jgi:hypothetical protein
MSKKTLLSRNLTFARFAIFILALADYERILSKRSRKNGQSAGPALVRDR